MLYTLALEGEAASRFTAPQVEAEIERALAVWTKGLEAAGGSRARGRKAGPGERCDLRVELGPRHPGDRSNGAFTQHILGRPDFMLVRINVDYVWHEGGTDYRWRSMPFSLGTVDDVAQQLGLTHPAVFWTTYRGFLHEFGHAFGLADTGDDLLRLQSDARSRSPGPQPNSLMKTSNYFYLTPDDRAGLAALVAWLR